MEPPRKPDATERETRDVLRELGAKGKVTEEQIKKMLRSGPIRTLQSTRAAVSSAVAGALSRMQRSGELEITDPKPGSRNAWGLFGDHQQDPLHAVETRVRRWISQRTEEGHRVTVAHARGQFKKQHRQSGGRPSDLTEVIKAQMRKMALAGELIPDSDARELLNLFSGGQSADAPARKSALNPTHVDILERYQLKPADEPEGLVHTRVSTDLRQAPVRGMVQWVARREGINLRRLGVVAAAIPCHTWTHLDATLRPSGHSYRTKSGKPNRKDPEKAQEAEEQYDLAENTTDSILDWVFQGAYMGVQRYFWIENGAWGVLGDQEFMRPLPDFKVASYCMYRARLHSEETYPSQKDTAIWTNLQGWTPRRCNHTQTHPGVIGGDSTQRPQLQDMTNWATKRWTPEELIWDLLTTLRHTPIHL